MSVESLERLYIDQLKDIYNAEKQLVRALPKIAKAAHSPELKSALQDHLEKTRQHVERLETIFAGMGRTASGKKCRGMEGVIEEGEELLNEDYEPSVMDAGLIASAQKVEHYEIASYGTLRSLAELKGDEKAAQLLQETLEEEYEADKTLTRIAESSIDIEGDEED